MVPTCGVCGVETHVVRYGDRTEHSGWYCPEHIPWALAVQVLVADTGIVMTIGLENAIVVAGRFQTHQLSVYQAAVYGALLTSAAQHIDRQVKLSPPPMSDPDFEEDAPGFERALQSFLNAHGIDTLTNTPDFILAHMLVRQIEVYGAAVARTKAFHAR